MELKVESKVGRLYGNDQRIYALLSECSNLEQFKINEKVKNWEADRDFCRFTVEGAGDVTIRVVERHPNDLIKFSIVNAQAENIFLWIQLKNVSPGDTRIKLTTKLDVNPMLKMLISKPLKQGLDKIVDTLENIGR